MKYFQNKFRNAITKILFNTTKRTISKNVLHNEKQSKKIKVKHHIPFIKKIISGNEQLITGIVIIGVLLGLWFLYMVFGNWSPMKFIGGFDQNEEVTLPGKNPYD